MPPPAASETRIHALICRSKLVFVSHYRIVYPADFDDLTVQHLLAFAVYCPAQRLTRKPPNS
jgi:hypothetical protein